MANRDIKESYSNLRLIGFRTEERLETCSFGEKTMPTHIFLFESNDQFFKLVVTLFWGECMSGWCAATWCKIGNMDPIDRTDFGPIHCIPSEVIVGTLTLSASEVDYKKDDGIVVVECDSIGGDSYYPSGYCEINLDLFETIGEVISEFPSEEDHTRELQPYEIMGLLAVGRSTQVPRSSVRVIYVFSGPSDLGKSTLAIHTDLSSYDTDQAEQIPADVYKYDIIVIGNRFSDHEEKVWSILDKKLETKEHFFRVIRVTFS